MSLDVYLKTPHLVARQSSGIFVRENGQTKEITREEWDEKNPWHEPCVVMGIQETNEVYSANITHNLTAMASEAGIYEHLWRPDEIGVTKASQLIEPLASGLRLMESDPQRFKKHNPKNGWGSYTVFIRWVADYLEACNAYPEAEVHVCR